MPDPPVLSDLEQLVLLGVLRRGEGAYGVTVRREIEEQGGRSASIAAVYAALDRLEDRGFLEAWTGPPTPERGGRAKRHFRLTAAGADALRAERAVMERMWVGVELDADTA